jgi:hypothetical protein
VSKSRMLVDLTLRAAWIGCLCLFLAAKEQDEWRLFNIIGAAVGFVISICEFVLWAKQRKS